MGIIPRILRRTHTGWDITINNVSTEPNSYLPYRKASLIHLSLSAWIGSLQVRCSSQVDIAYPDHFIQYSLTFLPCLITGRLFDIGYYKGPLLAASVVLVAATFLVAECTQYWHFLLCQGFAIGVGVHCVVLSLTFADTNPQLASGVIFGPTVSVISHWFRKRRSEAMGIVAVGSSIGGTIFPIVFRNLVGQVGYFASRLYYTNGVLIYFCSCHFRFKWTMRIIGFILMAIIAIPNLVRFSPLINVFINQRSFLI